MSDIQPGDRVRCTLGDNVLVGKVMGPVTDTHLSLIYGNAKYARLDRATWKVEVLDAEPDNFPREPGLYEVTWENGLTSQLNPYEVGKDQQFRIKEGDGSWSAWFRSSGYHRRATWRRLPDPLPPEPPVGTVLRDRHGFACQRCDDGWYAAETDAVTWAMRQHGPFTRLIPAPDPDDEQQVKALARALEKAEPTDSRKWWDDYGFAEDYRAYARAALAFLCDGGAR